MYRIQSMGDGRTWDTESEYTADDRRNAFKDYSEYCLAYAGMGVPLRLQCNHGVSGTRAWRTLR